MKKLFYVLVSVILLTACSEAKVTNMEPHTSLPAETLKSSASDESTTDSSSPGSVSDAISVTTPFTLSRNDLIELTKKQQFLNVVHTSGKYFEDWSPGPLMGRTWEGEFQIQLSNEINEVKSALVLNDYFKEGLMFNSLFDIEFDDYNGDGNIDFTIGQYGSSNYNIFKLFTLKNTGEIEELPIKGHSTISVSGSGRYSTKLTKTESGFSYSYYDNSIGKDVKQTFVWNGEEFVSENKVVL